MLSQGLLGPLMSSVSSVTLRNFKRGPVWHVKFMKAWRPSTKFTVTTVKLLLARRWLDTTRICKICLLCSAYIRFICTLRTTFQTKTCFSVAHCSLVLLSSIWNAFCRMDTYMTDVGEVKRIVSRPLRITRWCLYLSLCIHPQVWNPDFSTVEAWSYLHVVSCEVLKVWNKFETVRLLARWAELENTTLSCSHHMFRQCFLGLCSYRFFVWGRSGNIIPALFP